MESNICFRQEMMMEKDISFLGHDYNVSVEDAKPTKPQNVKS